MNTPKSKNRWSKTQIWTFVLAVLAVCGGAFYGGYYYRQAHQFKQAEQIMSFIRLEQEKQCAYHKHYTTNAKAFSRFFPKRGHKHFKYVFKPTGMEIHRKGRHGYVLKMPSYEDGRLCCDTPDSCRRLKGRFPFCADLKARADYVSGEECSPFPQRPLCKGPSVRRCGCQGKGIQLRMCDAETNTWGEWGKCSIADTCDCSAVSGMKPAAQTQVCNGCGAQSRDFRCNTQTGQWEAEAWSPCSRRPEECAPTSF